MSVTLLSMQILFSNQHIVAVNKPPGINVHGAPGSGESLQKVLCEQLKQKNLTPIHRLDKDASGVLLFAFSTETANDFQNHWNAVEKTYWALSDGIPTEKSGVIDAPILEHSSGKPERLEVAVRYFKEKNPGVELPPLPPQKTSAVHPAGRTSQTRYTVKETFGNKWAVLDVSPQQGRMHQIRVHLKHIDCPLAADKLYGRREMLSEKDLGLEGAEVLLQRMPLHAAKLKVPAIPFVTPSLSIEAPLPEDLSKALAFLRTAYPS
jgi:23S rRNA-/tRNA-specific pseudouridylate synthase